MRREALVTVSCLRCARQLMVIRGSETICECGVRHMLVDDE